MEKLIIHGGHELHGRVKISGAKNAVLPIIAATLLAQDKPCVLDEVPYLNDVCTIAEVLRQLGAKVDFNRQQHTLFVDSTVLKTVDAPYDLVRKMRASFVIMGPLLARYGKAKISMPVAVLLVLDLSIYTSKVLKLLELKSKSDTALSVLLHQMG